MLKIAGVLLLVTGFVFTIKPQLVSYIPESITAYQMIEKRVMWGILIGLGILGIFNHQIDSLKAGIFAFLAALTLGIIIARIIGLLMDGFYLKQLLWFGIEILLLVFFAILYSKQK
ncbi:hypothetical protein [Pedobacter agri]|uniref:hypothetical protein n=1 Tax=Pedobacter agri TaxID=454586 RepID=UPI0029312182|nr:hypothetical protein [Pedobacter agri]